MNKYYSKLNDEISIIVDMLKIDVKSALERVSLAIIYQLKKENKYTEESASLARYHEWDEEILLESLIIWKRIILIFTMLNLRTINAILI